MAIPHPSSNLLLAIHHLASNLLLSIHPPTSDLLLAILQHSSKGILPMAFLPFFILSQAARTSSLKLPFYNRIPCQNLHSLNALPSFSEKALFFTDLQSNMGAKRRPPQ